MKLNKSLILGVAGVMMMSSCNDWLDVNTNPDSPTIEQAKYEQLIPWSQFYMNHIYGIVASNSSFYCGHFVRPGAARELNASKWALDGATRAANAQQWFFTQVANNYAPMYDKSMEAGAYHYAGVAKFLRAWGFVMMVDLFGEIPYTEACGENPSPAYDTGDVIYIDCMKELDEAIALFSKPQAAGTTPLSAADYWNAGNTDKWIKACYLFKARWMNHLNKKSAGKWYDGKYDEAEILACLEKAQQSNADNTLVRHTDTNTNSHDVLGWNEPVDYNPMYSCIGMNSNIYVTKCYVDNLTNFDNKGVEDPRANKFIPWTRSEKTATTDPSIVWSEDGKWRRSLGVDLLTDILSKSGPYALTFKTDENRWVCDNKSRENDTVYVWTTCGGTGYNGGADLFYRRSANNDRSSMSGVFYARADAPSYVATYTEACFIKAEVLMRKGDRNGAYTAYKNGVRASIDQVNEQIGIWAAAFPNDAEHPTFKHMTDAEINAFMDGALGTAGDLTMGKIMTQKMLAMPFSQENWNDMRRHDFDKNIFMAWDKPYWFTSGTGTVWTYCPKDKCPRRWQQASYELNYNVKNLEAIGASVPGAMELPGASDGGWYNSPQICTLPVWWDRAD